MRYIKFLVLIVAFVVSMLFFVQNTQMLSQGVSLTLDVKYATYQSMELPLYLVILCAFAVGALLSMIYFLGDKIRLSSQLRSCKSRMKGLETELNSLRNMPLEEESYAAPQEEAKQD